MRNSRQSSPKTLLSLTAVCLALAAMFTSWAGCASGTSTTTTSAGQGGQSTTPPPSGGKGGHGGGTPTCSATEKLCGGTCVGVDDPAYGCGPTSCDACPSIPNADSACASGICTLGTCASGWSNCDGNEANGCEVNTDGDVLQCGACGSACVVPHATPNCVAGKCGIGTCDNGRQDCNQDVTDGCEAAPAVDPTNCGTCSNACGPGEGCENGVCGVYCPKNKANCDNNAANGCETPLGTVTDCAFCGDSCAFPNAQTSCDPVSNSCHLDQCDPGFANCDTAAPNGAANGCEVNTQTDANNCGFCGNVCPSGPHSTAACVNGGCVLNCDPGWSNCDNTPSTGCEVHSDVDQTNCGSCNHVCNIPNATAACTAGLCVISQCNTGFKDCTGGVADGCETNITNDPNNCNACGIVCTIANGTAACNAGACEVGTCNAGWKDCTGGAADGCETHSDVDTSNCGTCGNVCNLANANQACVGGTCAIGSCKTGFANCNNTTSDGCEVNTTSDPNNCNSCFHQCFVANGTAGCANSACTVASCTAPFADCINGAADGCETNTDTDVTHCGTCGNNCTTTCADHVLATACTSGACGITACASGYQNLDGTCTNGCECAAIATGGACSSPTSLGTLQLGQSTSYTGNLITAGQEAWLAVTFATNASGSYHPYVRFTLGVEYQFDVYSSCSLIAPTCGTEGGNATAKTSWEVQYTAGDPTRPANFQPIPAVGTGGQIWIRVFRKAGWPVTCNNWTLTVSN